MSEPTPGEWVAEKQGDDTFDIVAAPGPEQTTIVFRMENEADARLMAQAKAMANVLEMIRQIAYRHMPNSSYDFPAQVPFSPGLILQIAHMVGDAFGKKPSDDFPPRTTALALADAIFAGDDESAWILADEVHERLTQPEGFVPREELQRQIARLKTEVVDLERAIEYKNSLLRSATVEDELDRELDDLLDSPSYD